MHGGALAYSTPVGETLHAEHSPHCPQYGSRAGRNGRCAGHIRVPSVTSHRRADAGLKGAQCGPMMLRLADGWASWTKVRAGPYRHIHAGRGGREKERDGESHSKDRWFPAEGGAGVRLCGR